MDKRGQSQCVSYTCTSHGGGGGGLKSEVWGESTECIVMSLADKCLHPTSPFDRELHFNAVNISQIFNFSS